MVEAAERRRVVRWDRQLPALRGITATSGLVTGIGQVVHAGRLCATASITCLMFHQTARP